MTALVLVLHAASTWAMVGLIWLIQCVHYPLFSGVGESGFRAWHSRHSQRITPLVGVLMGLEGITYLILLAQPLPSLARQLLLASGLLLALHLVSTATLQIPLHGRLGDGYDEVTIERLVATNWVRTFAWTGRGLLVGWMLVLLWQPPLPLPGASPHE